MNIRQNTYGLARPQGQAKPYMSPVASPIFRRRSILMIKVYRILIGLW